MVWKDNPMLLITDIEITIDFLLNIYVYIYVSPQSFARPIF